jgi:uncharacterized membrane protein
MNKRVSFSQLDCLLLILVAGAMVFFLYTGAVPGGSDWATHMSKIRFIVDNLPSFPRWCPESGFGAPFLWSYPPLSYYLVAFITWMFQLGIFAACKFYFILILSIGAISTYTLAGELGMDRTGRLMSGLLLLGSFNLYSWWWIGQLPNMTAVMFAPLALLAFLRAIRKQTMFSILLAGVSYVPIILTHLLNTLIFAIILLCTSVVLIILKPELLFIRQGPGEPPKYTLVLPKVLLLSTIEAFALASWWWIPFLAGPNFQEFMASLGGTGIISAGQEAKDIALNMNTLLEPSLYYLGIGQLILVVLGFVILLKRRKEIREINVLPFIWFIISVFGGISPYLGIPMGLPYRFGPYMALAAALIGGSVLLWWKDFVKTLTKARLLVSLLCALLLACILYPPIIQTKNEFRMLDKVDPPAAAEWLQSHVKDGETVGSSSVNWINVFADVPQSYGASGYVNEFAYQFWYYMFHNRTFAYAPYFARNFNVKYFLYWQPLSADNSYFTKAYDNVYEINGVNSSLVESVEGKTLVLFIGEEDDYLRLFISLAHTDPSDIGLVYGGALAEDVKIEVLRRFDVVYLSGLDYSSLPEASSLLRQYVQEGGGLILDTGVLQYGGEMDSIPEPFPIRRTAIKTSHFNVTTVEVNNILENVDLKNFTREFANQTYSISYSEEERDGSSTLLEDDGEPVIVYKGYGEGQVLWNGLNLPYFTMLSKSAEGSKWLTNMIRFISRPSDAEATIFITYEQPSAEEIEVHVKNASPEDAIWVKVSYYPGWEASVNGKNSEIFLAGPNMMLVFPELNGDYTLTLRYGKTLAVTIGEIAAILGIIALAASFVIEKWPVTRRWIKTEHIGSGMKYVTKKIKRTDLEKIRR